MKFIFEQSSILLYRGNQKTMPQTNTENKTVEIKIGMDIQTYIIIPGIKLKFLSTKKLFQVLGGKQLQYIFKLAQ